VGVGCGPGGPPHLADFVDKLVGLEHPHPAR